MAKIEQRREEVAGYLQQNDGQKIRQRHIAASLGISQQMISRVLSNMIEEGAVARSNQDRRGSASFFPSLACTRLISPRISSGKGTTPPMRP